MISPESPSALYSAVALETLSSFHRRTSCSNTDNALCEMTATSKLRRTSYSKNVPPLASVHYGHVPWIKNWRCILMRRARIKLWWRKEKRFIKVHQAGIGSNFPPSQGLPNLAVRNKDRCTAHSVRVGKARPDVRLAFLVHDPVQPVHARTLRALLSIMNLIFRELRGARWNRHTAAYISLSLHVSRLHCLPTSLRRRLTA